MMLRFAAAFVSVSLAFSSSAFAQAPPHAGVSPSHQPPAPLANGRVVGTVFCADTHKPARGAFVLLDDVPPADERKSSPTGEGRTSQVAVDGTFTLEDVSPGDYVISAVLPGYLPPFDGLTISSASRDGEGNLTKDLPANGKVSVRPNETATVNISLERGAAVSGRVLYADGSPAIRVAVNVEDVDPKPFDDRTVGIGVVARSMLLHPAPITDDLGHFRISGIAPGIYHIVVIQSSTNDTTSGDQGLIPGMIFDFKMLSIYSGDTLHRKAAKQYELRSGDEISGVDITIPTDAFHSVRGLLTAKDGRPITTGTITLTDVADDTLIFHGDLERDGTFSFTRVPSGSYRLEAKNAEIGKLPDNLPPISSTRYIALRTTNVFADGSTSVIVKDSDVSNISLTLKEIPLPPKPKSGDDK